MSIYAQGGSVAIADTSGLQAIPTRILTVSAAGQGGQYTSIEDAITAATALVPAADNTILILVYPGTYAEKNLTITDWISIAGVDRETCIMEEAGGAQAISYNASLLQLVLSQDGGFASISNMTFHNTQLDTVAANDHYSPGIAVRTSGAGANRRALVDNCHIKGEETFAAINVIGVATSVFEYRNCLLEASADTFACSGYNDAHVFVDSCTIINTNTGNTAGTQAQNTWFSGTFNCHFTNCTMWDPADTGGSVLFDGDNVTPADGTHVYFEACRFLKDTAPVTPGPVMAVEKNTDGADNYYLHVHNSLYSVVDSDPGNWTMTLNVSATNSMGALVVNEEGIDQDSRFEGATDANLTYWDAGNDRVGIGTATPNNKLEISAATASVAADSTSAAGSAHFTASNDGAGIVRFIHWGSAQAGSFMGVTKANSANLYANGTTDFAIGTQDAVALTFSTNNTKRGSLSSAGAWTLGNASNDTVTIKDILALTLRAAAPAGAEGQIYANSTDHKLYYHNGTDWQEVAFV